MTLVLGILWNKSKDNISINPTVLNLNNPDIITKRVILSAAHKVFDPIGFTCPTTQVVTQRIIVGKNGLERRSCG